jgi:hypothetical protein
MNANTQKYWGTRLWDSFSPDAMFNPNGGSGGFYHPLSIRVYSCLFAVNCFL